MYLIYHFYDKKTKEIVFSGTKEECAKKFGCSPNAIRYRAQHSKDYTIVTQRFSGLRTPRVGQKHYAIYKLPENKLICSGNTQECVDQLGISRNAFQVLVSRIRNGKCEGRYEMFESPLLDADDSAD